MRVFIAISPPEETKSKIGEVISTLHRDFPSVKWENPEKLHLTLAFLGMLAEEKVNTLKDTLRHITSKFRAFELDLTEISYFYKKHDDSIIYIDIMDKSGQLKEFYKSLRRALLARDIFLPERIDPHIAIGRAKGEKHVHVIKELLVDIARTEIPRIGSFQVNSVNIYHSMFSKSENSSNYRLLQSSHFAPTTDTDL